MPVNFGNRKIKELYLGGRKIKEAWYGGQKVYSSAKSGVYPWHNRQDYHRGELVHYQGLVYECIQDHQADGSKTQPGDGWDQYSYWKQVGYVRERNDIKYDPWKNGRYYYSGEIVSATVNGVEGNYQCTSGHFASVDNRPGGFQGDQYWKFISKSSGSTPTSPPSSGGSTPTPTPSQPSQPADPPSNTPTAWRTGVDYVVRDRVIWSGAGMKREYLCIKDHRSSSDTEPYWGLLQDKHWQFVKEIS